MNDGVFSLWNGQSPFQRLSDLAQRDLLADHLEQSAPGARCSIVVPAVAHVASGGGSASCATVTPRPPSPVRPAARRHVRMVA